jgi:hypothetical protein
MLTILGPIGDVRNLRGDAPRRREIAPDARRIDEVTNVQAGVDLI